MPTVLRSGPYRIYFVSHDLNEPPHVHAVELRRVERLVAEQAPNLVEVWNEYFRRQAG